MNEYLPLMTLLRLLGVLALVLLPHATTLPGWEIAFIAALLAMRALAAIRQWRPPPGWARAALALVAFAGVHATFGRISGQVAGTALLCVMVALKVIELRARRDVMVIMFLMYFILMTVFLDSQEIWTVGYLLVCAVAITAMLAECNHPGGPLSPRITLRRGASMVAQSLPVMIALFVLFPRIPGPLWGLPSDSGSSRSGLSDEMAPGDIASLIGSDAVAFRVDFHDRVPSKRLRYWRGPVLTRFDGRAWKRAASVAAFAPIPDVLAQGALYRYDITLEPNRMPWVFGLEAVLPDGRPPGIYMTTEAELVAARPVRERIFYSATSATRYRYQAQLDADQRRVALQLPKGVNPRTLALGRSWSAENADGLTLARRALAMFHQQNFVYTLKPGTLGPDSVDEFLFESRRGFCEHYSSAFTVLMRAAGVPARVVTGYLGGDLNEVGGYYVVSQSDAHAWSEIWVEGSGWVRMDPTAAVAPDRVEKGLESALSVAEGLPGYLHSRGDVRHYFAVRWDWINARWNGLVLAYGPQLQQDFLSHFGIDDAGSMILALTIISVTLLTLVSLVLMRQFAPAQSTDIALRHWRHAARKLLKAGIAQRPDEGPRDFVERALQEAPELAAPLREVLAAYLGLRYLREPDAQTEQRLALAVKSLRT